LTLRHFAAAKAHSNQSADQMEEWWKNRQQVALSPASRSARLARLNRCLVGLKQPGCEQTPAVPPHLQFSKKVMHPHQELLGNSRGDSNNVIFDSFFERHAAHKTQETAGKTMSSAYRFCDEVQFSGTDEVQFSGKRAAKRKA